MTPKLNGFLVFKKRNALRCGTKQTQNHGSNLELDLLFTALNLRLALSLFRFGFFSTIVWAIPLKLANYFPRLFLFI